eukprot:CFRG7070T1
MRKSINPGIVPKKLFNSPIWVIAIVGIIILLTLCGMDNVVVSRKTYRNTKLSFKPPPLPKEDDRLRSFNISTFEVPDCGWVNPSLYQPKWNEDGKVVKATMEVFNALRHAGIAYYVSSGTALGVVRHGGMVPGDSDLDIQLPAQLNYKAFRQHSTLTNSTIGNCVQVRALGKKGGTSEDQTLCGLGRHEWRNNLMIPALLAALNGLGFSAVEGKADDRKRLQKCWDVIHSSNKIYNGCLFVDVSLTLKARENRPEAVCRCPWYSQMVICQNNTPELLAVDYSTDYMTPARDLLDSNSWYSDQNGVMLLTKSGKRLKWPDDGNVHVE